MDQFEVQQIITEWYPKAAEAMGPKLVTVLPELLPKTRDEKTELARTWKLIENSLCLCVECGDIAQCKQEKEHGGTGYVGMFYVPTTFGYLMHSLRPCHWKKISDEAKDKPWLEKRHSEKTFAGYIVTDQNRPAFTACHQYLRRYEHNIETGVGIVLSGPTGVGKTHLASVLFREMMLKTACTGTFLYMPDYIAEIKNRFGNTPFDKLGGPPSESVEAYIDATMSCKFVVLDNFEFRQVTDWLVDVLNRIIDYRYRLTLSTIVTTGWSPERMAEMLEDKLPSRLTEMGEWFSINEKDWRRKQSRSKSKTKGGSK